MLRTLPATVFTALIAMPVAADGFDYARLSYDYLSFDGDLIDIGNSFLQGGVNYSFGQVLLSAEFNTFTFMPSAGDDQSTTRYFFGAGYEITPEVLLGVGVTSASGDAGDANGFESFAQYQTAGLAVGVNAWQFDTDEDNISTRFLAEFNVTPAISFGAQLSTNSEFDGTGYWLYSEYAEGPIFARAYAQGNTEVDDGVFGLRGTYDVTPDIRASAAFSVATGVDDSISFVSAGAGYRIVEGVWANADIGQFSEDTFGGVDVTRVGLNLTYEMGEHVRIDRRFYQDIIDDNIAGLR